ncbi:MAG: adenosylcobinamide amidohydrolase [Candidatus Bathyarchaeota archaeon]|nr:adenosylcobinamide amidohydrolase [Candidatus Bathyarchaeum tardum]WGM89478.1 MAG: adenosylcobinamide amidohydrolase [Candidatus Bathyarchaeum tardum]
MKEKPIDIGLDGVKAKLVYNVCDGFQLNTLLVSFEHQRRVFSTKESFKQVNFVGNAYVDGGLFEQVRKSFGDQLPVDFDLGIDHKVIKTLGLVPEEIALLNTAVNMEHVALSKESYEEFKVCCFASAGTGGNALRMGVDKADWTERNGIYVSPLGTINIIVLTNSKLTDSAMARAIITVTEAKTAVLQDLKIKSSLTPQKQATGTGTDHVIIVSGTGSKRAIQCTSGHTKMGELIAVATKKAVTAALKKHDGSISVRSLLGFRKNR